MSLCVEGDRGPQHSQIKTWREKRPCVLTIIQKNRYVNAERRKTLQSNLSAVLNHEQKSKTLALEEPRAGRSLGLGVHGAALLATDCLLPTCFLPEEETDACCCYFGCVSQQPNLI